MFIVMALRLVQDVLQGALLQHEAEVMLTKSGGDCYVDMGLVNLEREVNDT